VLHSQTFDSFSAAAAPAAAAAGIKHLHVLPFISQFRLTVYALAHQLFLLLLLQASSTCTCCLSSASSA
jgi:hypothetical protein